MVITKWKLVIARIFDIEDTDATGDEIKHWLLHAGAQAAGIVLAFLIDYLSQSHLGWRLILLQGITQGGLGNACLQIRTPRVKRQIERSKPVAILQTEIKETQEGQEQ